MKHLLLVASFSLAAACAGMASRPPVNADAAGNWHGYVLHDGLREPIFVSLDEDDTGSIAGTAMAGTVSGSSAGAFALDRQPEWNPYPNGP